MTPHHHHSSRRWWYAGGLGVCLLLLVPALLLAGYGGLLTSVLPFLLFLLCPAMHLLMMRGHGSHGHGPPEGTRDRDAA